MDIPGDLFLALLIITCLYIFSQNLNNGEALVGSESSILDAFDRENNM